MANNKNHNGRYNNNKNNNRNNQSRHNDAEHQYTNHSRSIENLLSIDSEEVIFDKDDYNNFNNKYDDRENNNGGKKEKNFNKNVESYWDNPLCKFLKKDIVYDRDDVYNVLVKKNGLIKMIEDLKSYHKDHKQKKPTYPYLLLRDIVFASALPDAIDKVTKKDEFESYTATKKDLEYLMDEIIMFLKNANDGNLIRKYGEDGVKSMQNAYINILYKFNKKKVKKFKDIKGISDQMAKQLIVMSSGKSINQTIYQVLKYLYNEADNIEFTINKKNILKIFKICYGKDNIKDIIKCLMLERNIPAIHDKMSQKASTIWIIIDQIIIDELEDMDKKDIEKIIKSYINDRKHQETDRRIPRRFTGSKSIFEDDYPKLTKVLKKIENKDFSVAGYLK